MPFGMDAAWLLAQRRSRLTETAHDPLPPSNHQLLARCRPKHQHGMLPLPQEEAGQFGRLIQGQLHDLDTLVSSTSAADDRQCLPTLTS